MTMEDKIEKIEKIDKSLRSTEDGVTETEELARMPPNKQHFDALIAESTVSKTAATEAVEAVSKDSLIDELSRINSKVDRFSKVNPAQLVAQADTVIEQINTIKEKLTTKDLEIKPATQTLLQNKLQHIDENLRVALSKAGIEYTPAEMLENKSVNPVERFLGFHK